MHFGNKRLESGPSCSHEFAIFLKYHMPLSVSLVLWLYWQREKKCLDRLGI